MLSDRHQEYWEISSSYHSYCDRLADQTHLGARKYNSDSSSMQARYNRCTCLCRRTGNYSRRSALGRSTPCRKLVLLYISTLLSAILDFLSMKLSDSVNLWCNVLFSLACLHSNPPRRSPCLMGDCQNSSISSWRWNPFRHLIRSVILASIQEI